MSLGSSYQVTSIIETASRDTEQHCSTLPKKSAVAVTKHCLLHGDGGHTTDECYALQNEAKRLKTNNTSSNNNGNGKSKNKTRPGLKQPPTHCLCSTSNKQAWSSCGQF